MASTSPLAEGAPASTQQDVARLAGVNRATVSRALDPQRRHLLTDETVHRVTAAAAQLEYRPHSLAQGLRRQRSGVVRLSLPRAMIEQSPDFVGGVEDGIQDAALGLLISLDDSAVESSRGLVDGAIHVGGARTWESKIDGPVVRVGLAPGDALDVTIDHHAGIATAVGHLARRGHVRIAMVCEPDSSSAGARHRSAFSSAMDSWELDARSVLPFQPRRPASAVEACLTLLNRADRPTAILLSDDGAAAGCYGAARQVGLRVPDDLSIVGYGDAAIAAFLDPPLTTMSVPAYAAGLKAADHLVARLAGGTHPPTTLTPHLIQRGSTAPPLG